MRVGGVRLVLRVAVLIDERAGDGFHRGKRGRRSEPDKRNSHDAGKKLLHTGSS
jgi:hypothetical protein